MDIDDVQQPSTSSAGAMNAVMHDGQPAAGTSTSKRNPQPSTSQIHLSSDDPFDLDSYIAPYSGRRRIERLLFIARTCPTLRSPAYTMLLQGLRRDTLDYKLYLDVISEASSFGISFPSDVADEVWAEETRVKQESGLDKLDVELKNYQNNLIKESIRMGYRDLGDFNRKSGDLPAAIRNYTKSRDFCTTSQHILDMCLSVIDTALDQCAYSTIRGYVIKAEAALSSLSGPPSTSKDSPSNGTAATNGPMGRAANLPGMVSSAQPGRREEEARSRTFALIGEKLSIADAVASLGLGDFEKAARKFLNVATPPAQQIGNGASGSGINNTAPYISPADIGVYGVLCGMATLDRGAFQRLILENTAFRPYLDSSAFLKDLVRSYHSSNYLTALATMQTNMSRFSLDIHLAKHVITLVHCIRDKMLQGYFEPYKAVKTDKMAKAFGWDSAVLDVEVERLIEQGTMKARIDRREKTIVSHTPDPRDTLYVQALAIAKANDRSTKQMALRMKLIQNDLITDNSKDSTVRQQQQQQHQQGQGSAENTGSATA